MTQPHEDGWIDIDDPDRKPPPNTEIWLIAMTRTDDNGLYGAAPVRYWRALRPPKTPETH